MQNVAAIRTAIAARNTIFRTISPTESVLQGKSDWATVCFLRVVFFFTGSKSGIL